MFSNDPRGPYLVALGEDAALLHPQLRAYVDPVPAGYQGRGTGVYTEAGLRLPLLRPVFALLGRWGIAFPERAVDVPFDICNSSTGDGGVRAVRIFRFGGRTRTMVDETRVVDGILTDRIGRRGVLEVTLAARVDRGGLVLESRRLALRIGRLRVLLPRILRVELDERAVGGGSGLQRVDLRVTMPVLGEVYGYRGTFAYAIRPGAAADTVEHMDEPQDAGAEPSQVVRFCRHRSQGRRCTRPLGHAGLHRHRTILWSDAGSDPARCAGSGQPGEPAATLPDGYPDGRALCPRCQRFVTLDGDGHLAPHDASDDGESDAEIARRRAWLNTHGW